VDSNKGKGNQQTGDSVTCRKCGHTAADHKMQENGVSYCEAFNCGCSEVPELVKVKSLEELDAEVGRLFTGAEKAAAKKAVQEELCSHKPVPPVNTPAQNKLVDAILKYVWMQDDRGIIPSYNSGVTPVGQVRLMHNPEMIMAAINNWVAAGNLSQPTDVEVVCTAVQKYCEDLGFGDGHNRTIMEWVKLLGEAILGYRDIHGRNDLRAMLIIVRTVLESENLEASVISALCAAITACIEGYPPSRS